MEFLYSDEGQLLFVKGYATPARFDDLKKRNVVPADTLAKLPQTSAQIGLPSANQINAAAQKIKTDWPTIVGLQVK